MINATTQKHQLATKFRILCLCSQKKLLKISGAFCGRFRRDSTSSYRGAPLQVVGALPSSMSRQINEVHETVLGATSTLAEAWDSLQMTVSVLGLPPDDSKCPGTPSR